MTAQSGTVQQTAAGSLAGVYACPACKGPLQPQPDALACAACRRTYPIIDGIPDFLVVRPAESANYYLRHIDRYGRLARIYETNLWYPLVLNLYAGWGVITFKDIVAYVHAKIQPVTGLVLDVGTGTGTYGRRVARAGRTVYGIDLSPAMLRVGQANTRREGVTQMHFSRADVEALPFGAALFDGCITSGCLHLFPDTLKALTEIGRTLKPGAPLIVITFTWSDKGILKYEWMRRRIRERGRLKVFALPALQADLERAGFGAFEPDARGGLLLFTARKI